MTNQVNKPTVNEIQERSDVILKRIKDLFEKKNDPQLTFYALKSLGKIAAKTLESIS